MEEILWLVDLLPVLLIYSLNSNVLFNHDDINWSAILAVAKLVILKITLLNCAVFCGDI